MSRAKKRIKVVLERLVEFTYDDVDDSTANVLAEQFECMLEELHGEDFFGTEGQCDPRGDFRDGTWSMYKVQGIDK